MEETSTLTVSDANNEIIPPAGHPRVGRDIFKILELILKYKADQGLPAKWHRCYELSKGKHWRKESKKATLITANLLFAHRQRTVAMLTDNNPTFNSVQSGEIPDERMADVDTLRHTASHWWSDTEQQDVLETSVLNGETYGIVVEKVRFDPNIEYGIGEVVTDKVDAFHFGWFPVDAEDNQAAEVNLHFRPMPLREARRRWPDMAGKIMADQEWIDQLGDNRKEVISPMAKDKAGYFASFMGAVKNMFNTAEDTAGTDDTVLIVECWVRDRTRVPVEGGEQDLYPGNIRTIWTCNGGEVVLEDRPNASINWDVLPPEQARQTFLFDKFPFNCCVSVKDTASPWGMTDIEQLESMQIEMNKTMSQITLMKDKASRINIVNPKNSGVSAKQFNNAYGVIEPKNHVVSASIRVLEQPKIPPEIIPIFQLYRELFFLVAGSFDLEQADAPGSNAIAYKAIAALLERVATLLRGKLRNYHKLIRNRGRMYLSCAMNWYIDERWIAYNVDGEEQTRPIKGADLIIPAKLKVVSGSTMPVSKVQQREEALELRKMGSIDDEELLKRLEWPEWKKVIERLKRGPMGIAMDRFVELGMPQHIAEYLLEVGVMEEKDFEKAFQKGELPMIMPLLQGLPMPEEGAPSPVEQGEVMVKNEEAKKIAAETELIREKIETERVQQQVALAGVELDKERMTIDRAKTVFDMQRSKVEQDMERENADREVFNAERDRVEGQEDKAHERKTAEQTRKDERADKGKEFELREAEMKAKSAEKKSQGPYRERGMKSNNKQK